MDEIKKILLFKVRMADNVIEPLKNVLYSGFIAQGEKVDEFEEKLNFYTN